MDNSSFFHDCYTAAKRLDDHGFSSHPNVDDLALYMMDLSDRIDSICAFLKIETFKDHRKRWIVHSAGDLCTNSSEDLPW